MSNQTEPSPIELLRSELILQAQVINEIIESYSYDAAITIMLTHKDGHERSLLVTSEHRETLMESLKFLIGLGVTAEQTVGQAADVVQDFIDCNHGEEPVNASPEKE